MPLHEGSDAAVIAESQTNPEAFGVIFDRYHGRVFEFAARRIGPEPAADVVSDVFVAAFRSRAAYDPKRGKVLPWLYGIAVNVLGDRLKRVTREQRQHLLILQETPTTFEDDVAEGVDAETVARALNPALDGLSIDDRNALLLFALEQLTYAEIAQVLDVPSGTVASRINRARRVLREAIADFGQRTGWEQETVLGQIDGRTDEERRGEE